jgi:hypothetical protein
VVGQSAQRIYELAKLHEEISMAAAERMLAIWRTSMPPRRADLVRQVRAVITQGMTAGRATASSRAAPVPHVPASSEHAASTAAPALPNPASAHASREADSPGDDLGYWWDRQDAGSSSMLAAIPTLWPATEPAAQERVASSASGERAAPAAHVAGQARAHAHSIRTRYLTHDTVYWNDELPDARAGSTPGASRAPAEREAEPARKKSGERS